MKYPTPQTFSVALLCTCLLGAMMITTSAEARIGERRESLERRLTSSGGIVYRDEALKENRRKGMPYLKYFEHLGNSADLRIYFKTSDGRRPSSSELGERGVVAGWDLHVVYINGKSAIEVYKRSQAISEHEMNHLLALHSGGSFWKRPEKEEKAEAVSAFGFDMLRDDGAVRAKKLGNNMILIVDAVADARLAEMNETDLQERAPTSVNGF